MSDFSKFPTDHRRGKGRHMLRLADGTEVILSVGRKNRPLRGNELVKASMQMKMGRMPSMQVEEDDISLVVGQRWRMEISILPSGYYSYGRLHDRSLRALAQKITYSLVPRPEASNEGAETIDPPSFSR